MRVIIDQREVLSGFGRIHFYVDCTVQFSEAEKAVIRNRQLGDHSITVQHDVPWFRHMRGWVIADSVLFAIFMITGVSLLPALAIMPMMDISGNWWALLLLACIGSWLYRRHLRNQFAKMGQERNITLSQMMKKPKFTVYAPDAFLAADFEQAFVEQLDKLKRRIVQVAPGLAEKQVYASE